MISLRQLQASDAGAVMDGLVGLLQDTVDAGAASVGFLADASRVEFEAYWRQVFAALGPGLLLWVAEQEGRIVGTIQLAPCLNGNSRHRAEIRKVLVGPSLRGQKLASRLLQEVERHAATLGIWLLVLDTMGGSQAEAVYRHLGWTCAGTIPDYAASPDGVLHPTVYFYKTLPR